MCLHPDYKSNVCTCILFFACFSNYSLNRIRAIPVIFSAYQKMQCLEGCSFRNHLISEDFFLQVCMTSAKIFML